MIKKIFLAIKTWILLQLTKFKNWWLSLFTDEGSQPELHKDTPLQEQTSSENPVNSEAPDEGIHAPIEAEVHSTNTAVQPGETPVIASTSWPIDSDTQPVVEVVSSIPTMPSEPVNPYYTGKYDYLFLTIKTEVPLSVVDEEIWDVIKERLPEGYTIPASTSKMLYTIKFPQE